MRLSWNEIRTRAAAFADEWKDASYEKGETQSFYNTFPIPPGFAAGKAHLSRLEPPAQAVLDARATYPDTTLADLYDPDLMPPNLRRAHQALDRAVDRLYRRSAFGSDSERFEHLLMLYEKSRAPLETGIKPKHRRRPRRRRAG